VRTNTITNPAIKATAPFGKAVGSSKTYTSAPTVQDVPIVSLCNKIGSTRQSTSRSNPPATAVRTPKIQAA